MTSRLRKRLAKAVGVNIYAQFVTIAIQILSIPLYISHWGIGTYGEWALISAIQTYFLLTDFGMFAAAMNRISVIAADNCRDSSIQDLFNACLTYAMTVGSLVVLASTLTAEDWATRIGFPISREGLHALQYLICYTQLCQFNSIIDAAFRAENRYARGTFLLETARLVDWLSGIAALLIGGTLSSVAMATVVSRCIWLAGLLYVLGKSNFACNPLRYRPCLRPLRQIFSFGLAWFSIKMFDVCVLNGTTIIVGHISGTKAAAEYSAYRTISRAALQLTSALSNSLWPEFSRLVGTGQQAKLVHLLRTSLTATASGALVISTFIFIFANEIVSDWTRSKIPLDRSLLALFLLAASTASLNYTCRIYLAANSKTRPLAIGLLVVVLVAALPVVWLVQHHGNLGAAVGSLAIEALALSLSICVAMRATSR